VLFPTGDDAELIHDLDRFCTREKFGSLLHFRISQTGVIQALKNGMSPGAIVGLLEAHCRTPLPQNVRFSIRDWALRAGLMSLGEDLVLRCQDPLLMKRFLSDPGTRKHVHFVIDRCTLRLRGGVTPRRMQVLLRELGYLVELSDRP
jgi:hypothetical protein